MLITISRVATALAVAATAAAAQGAPAPSAAPAGNPGAPSPEFTTGAYYAGPRVWLGNLNGAVAIGGQVERGFTQPNAYGPGIIAGGIGVDYYSWSYDYSFGSYKYSVVPLQAFGNYHFIIEGNKKLDPYAGLALVYSMVNASWNGAGVAADAEASGIDIAGQAGVRYFVNEKFAVQGQVGFGYGTLGLGATWRF